MEAANVRKNIIENTEIKHVGGDFRVGDEISTIYNINSIQEKASLQNIDEDLFNKEDYSFPVFYKNLVEKVQDEKVLIVGGNYNFNKETFLKYFAVRFKNEIEAFAKFPIKEVYGFHSFHSLVSAIRENKEPSIFILNQLDPQKINCNFQELSNISKLNGHLLLISTAEPPESWLLSASELEKYFFEVPLNNIYSVAALEKLLTVRLEKEYIQLPSEFNVSTLSAKLDNIEQVNLFVEMLRKEEEVTAEVVTKSLSLISITDFSAIGKWFKMLSHDSKLIAIGLCLFDGLMEDQFFEAMDKLIQEGWGNRSHGLKSLDYADLIPLMAFYKIEGATVSGKFSGQRKALLQAIWNSHKRYLLASLPVLVKLVSGSVSVTSKNWILYGTKYKRRNIRNVVAEAFSEIGAISFFSIESSLICLAANRDQAIRMVIAKVIAKQKEINESDFFRLIEKWQNDKEIKKSIYRYIDGVEDKKTFSDIENMLIPSTLATVMGYASDLNKEVGIDRRIIEELKGFTRFNNKMVIASIQQTLHNLTISYHHEIKDDLRDHFLQFTNYISPVAYGLATAYNNLYEGSVKSLLYEWVDFVEDNPGKRSDDRIIMLQDKIIITVVQTIVNIDFDLTNHPHAIRIEEAYQLFEGLRKTQHHKSVRSTLLNGILKLIEISFDKNQSIAINYISNLDEIERDYLVAEFRKKYLKERSNLTGGEYNITFYGKYDISSWKDPSAKPKTNVEKLLGKWLDHSDTAIQQLAGLAYLEFARIESTEEEVINNFLLENQKLNLELERAKNEIEIEIVPEYGAEIIANEYTRIFIKIASHYVPLELRNKLEGMAAPLVQSSGVTNQMALKLINELGKENEEIINHVFFLFKLFTNQEFDLRKSPLQASFASNLFSRVLKSGNHNSNVDTIDAFVPFMIQFEALNFSDGYFILKRITGQDSSRLKMTYTFFRMMNKKPLLVIGVVLFILAILVMLIF